MQFADQLNPHGLGEAVEVFSTSAGFEYHGQPLAAAFNPAFTLTSRGTMMAFAEGRLGSSHDDAPKTVIINRSNDFGHTWEGMRALTVPGCHFGPRPYVFEKNGCERACVLVVFSRYHLKQKYPDESRWGDLLGIDFAGLHPRAVSIVVRLISDDDGETWHPEALVGDRDPFAMPETGRPWVGFGDFTGTVETIPSGPHAGRRFVAISARGLDPMSAPPPENFRELERLGSSIMYSDDGETWHVGGVIADQRGNEAAAAAIGENGTIVMLRRPDGFSAEDLERYDRLIGYRLIHRSTDGGQTWSAPVFPEGLPYLKQDGRRFDHQCLPSLCTWDSTLLTAAPSAVHPETGQAMRARGVIGYSSDLGLTWRHKLIDEGEFSYATLGRVGDNGLIVMFSRGTHGERGSFLRAFTMDWLRTSGRV